MNSLASCTDTKKMKIIDKLHATTYQILLGYTSNGPPTIPLDEQIKFMEFRLALPSPRNKISLAPQNL